MWPRRNSKINYGEEDVNREARGVLVFISYHTPDHDKAQAVRAALALRRLGTEWYFAPRNITGGPCWVPGLADAVARSDGVLFLAGRHIRP
jgi:hypothetical protein